MAEWLTTDEAAELLRVSKSTIVRYIRDGEISAAQLPGKQWRIRRQDVEELLIPKAAS
jgi:excisionase family DNA binding protein